MNSAFSEIEEFDFAELDLARYRTIEESNITLKSRCNGELSILYINIVSLPSNMDIFHNFLSNFETKPDLICLSETKITVKCNAEFHPYLENYTFYNIKSKTHFGGVGIFIRDELTVTKRDDLNRSELGLYETLWFDVSNVEQNTSKTTIGIVYRHPGQATIPHMTSYMETVINQLTREKANYFILGDYNINLLRTHEIHNISEFVNTL